MPEVRELLHPAGGALRGAEAQAGGGLRHQLPDHQHPPGGRGKWAAWGFGGGGFGGFGGLRWLVKGKRTNKEKHIWCW